MPEGQLSARESQGGTTGSMAEKISRYWIFLAVGAAFSVAWLAAVEFYVSALIGWDNLLFMLPHEIGGFFGGVFAPLAFVWKA